MSYPSPQKNSSPFNADQVVLDGSYSLNDFQYDLPEELIAQEPLPERHDSRLMAVRIKERSISHHQFLDIANLLQPGDILIVNDTRVIPARLLARKKTGGLVQILLLKQVHGTGAVWQALATPLKKLRPGDTLTVEPNNGQESPIIVKDIVQAPDGHRRLLLDFGSQERTYALLAESGYAPLPPYIRQDEDMKRRLYDLERYQTVFASTPGAVAAPTAGLHFSQAAIRRLKERGIEIYKVTLHVGPGTFKPITTSLEEHTVEREHFSIPETTAIAVNSALSTGRRIVAVGTTSCRALETAGSSGRLVPTHCSQTSLYIRPGYAFRVVSGLVTNFHLSGSSLLVLVSAFAGHKLIMNAYREAIEERYRFFSYGDAMLLI